MVGSTYPVLSNKDYTLHAYGNAEEPYITFGVFEKINPLMTKQIYYGEATIKNLKRHIHKLKAKEENTYVLLVRELLRLLTIHERSK